MKFLAAILLAFSFTSVMACSEDGSSGFLPENNLNIPVGSKLNGGLTEEKFNAVIDKVETIYAPIVSNMGGNLSIARKWSNGTVNANATRMGSTWFVNMFGGLARHETITEDGFALVLCHEIGHHIGGAPKINSLLGINKWASNEGQADYFSALKCLRRAFLNDNNSAVVKKLHAPEALVKACSKAWSSKTESSMCVRIGMAGASVAALFASMSNKPEAKFETPDTKVVARTDDAHPAYQCRLDTFFQGALCETSFTEDVSQKEEVKGTCHGTLGHKTGLRPLCWFKPAVL